MEVLRPVGPRVLVKDDPVLDEVTARAKAAGIHVVVLERNVPRSTTGRVVAVGDDPHVQELIKLGDTVFFHRLAGQVIIVEGEEYRSLDFHEILAVKRSQEG